MRELMCFAGVGLGATFTHYFMALLLVEVFSVAVLMANVLAYCCAVGVSYFGHSLLTFRVSVSRRRLVKFIVVSVSSLVFSQALLAFLMQQGWFDYKVNMLFVVVCIPCLTYLMSKFWVYRDDRDNEF